jgi:deoxycytidine triphosphate deaminase
MSVLSDRDLQALYPEYKGTTGPASIDLAIGDTLLSWPTWVRRDSRLDQSGRWVTETLDLRHKDMPPAWILKTGVRYLATTRDPIRIPDDCAGQLAARSSWGRDGLAVICGPAGWLDPGYHGRPTMELSVVGSELVLWPGAVICQLILFGLTSPCQRPYAGKYMDDLEPTPSRLHLEAP